MRFIRRSKFGVGQGSDAYQTDFDQAIIETSNGKDFWIHISCRKNKKKNHHQIFRDMRKK